jgi:solute carrier family 25 phosphate transporter 23/24/25/41
MFAYDTVKTFLTPKYGEPSRISFPVPVSLVAGAAAGVSSTITMYPLELLKTRLTVEVKDWRPNPACWAIALE